MATLKQIRQRLRDYAIAREQNAHDEITAAFAHVHTAIDDLTAIIDTAPIEPVPEPAPEPDPDPTPEPEPEPEPTELYGLVGIEDGDVVPSPLVAELTKLDGSWDDLPRDDSRGAPGVTKVEFFVDGVSYGSETAYPFIMGGSDPVNGVDLTSGEHVVSWGVGGDEPESGTVRITVEVADQPAPEPSPAPDGSVLTSRTFDAETEDGWTWRGDGPDASFEIGSAVFGTYGQANYYPSLPAGTGPIQTAKRWSEVDEVTVVAHYQASPNMDPYTGSNNKKIYFLESPTANPIIIGLKGTADAGTNRLYVNLQSCAEQPHGARAWQGGTLVMGQVYEVVFHVKLNSVGSNGNSNPDGVIEVFLDGDRVMYGNDVRFRGEDSPQRSTGQYFSGFEGIRGIRWNPTWPASGQSGEPPAEHMWERFYDITVYRGAPSSAPGVSRPG